jgi:hypothetical protein
MSSKQIRIIARYAHLVEGILIALFIYSPALRNNGLYAGFIQFVVLPLIVLSGLLLWQLPRINKWRNRRPAMATTTH